MDDDQFSYLLIVCSQLGAFVAESWVMALVASVWGVAEWWRIVISYE
jgi:hypothetical protein